MFKIVKKILIIYSFEKQIVHEKTGPLNRKGNESLFVRFRSKILASPKTHYYIALLS